MGLISITFNYSKFNWDSLKLQELNIQLLRFERLAEF